ncbi:TonB-dependent receptor [Croceicoccus sp. Ery5]|uniref:TonB-dependent receptor n=1 Tax=Croceicoccus sp. Ery5 TaxID=1703340 RepID=UPI001E49A43D|nr:TonB-dependent receptor [Croceicoccus sp. Ery5]
MKKLLLRSTAIIAVAVPAAAHAQSTGSIDFEDEIIVTGALSTDVGGVEIPDTPKAKVQLDSELILRQVPGQTINDTLNLVPGVSFTNNDPFGSLGGSFTIRGFSSDRISQTLDGIPLNDSGNYALYTNQMIDPEIIESATVSLGSTDVDSPTASAAGGTVNIRTKTPDDDFGIMTALTYGNIISRGDPGDRMMYRVFAKVETGELTAGGLKAYFTASKTQNDSTFSNYGGVDKQQYNGKIFQPFGDNGDFVAVAGHYNENRNNFNGSPFRYTGEPSPIQNPEDRFYDLYDGTPCQTDEPEAGVADTTNSCGSPFERRYNPSNTGNVRINSRFTLADPLVLTVDPFYQYVKANGGGTSTAYEYGQGDLDVDGSNGGGIFGVIGGRYYTGIDLNGDGDLLDAVRALSPSQTQTHRYGVIANLAWELNDFNRVRVAYTYDRARHRQTGQLGYLYRNAEPYDVFPVNDPILDANGIEVNKRDRKSIAELHQISGEYRGEFFDDALTVLLGARVPFFKRELNQYCVTTDSGGNVNCINGADAIDDYLVANPTYVGPTSRTVDYSKFLPNVGATFNITNDFNIFASYAKNISVPGTDALYGAIFADLEPDPETSDSFDLGLRWQNRNIQAQLTGWFNGYQNRLASAYNLECDCTITRNLGKVEKYGIDGSIAYRPISDLLFYVWGSYLESEIKDDVQTSATEFAATSGMREAGAPDYMIGGRVQGTLGPVELGAQVKRTGSRYLNDINTIKLPGYTTADLDLRLALGHFAEALEESYVQFNVTNIFDEVYIGSAPTGLTTSGEYVNIGAPRAFTASLIWGF